MTNYILLATSILLAVTGQLLMKKGMTMFGSFPISQMLQNIIDKAALIAVFFTALTGIMYLFENKGHIKTIVLRFYRVFIPSDL